VGEKGQTDQLKSTTKWRKEKVVISDKEEDLVSDDPSKQGRMSETEYEDVETEHVTPPFLQYSSRS
ncbi:hypothetical protein Tco_0636680, partial [Tanacetum coccineum]